MTHSLTRTGVLASALLSAFSFAAYDGNQALALLEAQQFDQAYQYLDRELDRNTAAQQDLFLLGMAAKQSGHYDEAAQTFLTMLAREPNVARVQLELIDAYQLGGHFNKAEALSTSMLASDQLDDRAKGKLQQFSGALAQRKSGASEFGVSLYGSVGYIYDSNVNSGPTIDQVSILNLPFTLSPDAKRTADSGIESSAGINLQKSFSAQDYIYGGVSLDHNNYFDQSDFDKTVLSARIGYGRKLDQNWSMRIPISISYSHFGQEKPLEYIDYSLSPALSYRINSEIELGMFTSITHRTFKNAPSKDTYTFGANANWQRAQHSIYGNATFTTENAMKDSDEADRFSLSSSYRYQLNDSTTLSTGGSIELARFHGVNPLFGTKRKEVGFDINAGLTYRIPQIGADLISDIKYHTNRGNLDYYNYDKTTISISLQKTFTP